MSHDRVKITGLWKGTDKNGNPFLSGNLNQISKLLVMKNTYKKAKNEPDYFIYLAPAKEKPAQNQIEEGAREEL